MSRVLVALLVAVAGTGCGGAKQPAVQPAVQPAPPAQAAPSPVVVDQHAVAKERVRALRADAERDPMLAAWPGPHGGVPPWAQVKASAFPAAFDRAIALRAAEVEVIVTDPEPPSFQNTYVTLEDVGRHLDRAETLFGVLSSSLNTDDVKAVDREWSPKLSAATDAIIFDTRLFARMTAVFEARQAAGLTAEQQRLVSETYDRFVRAGARLSAAQKQQMAQINQELAIAFSDFGNKVLADEDSWIVLASTKDLAGLPESLVAAYKAAADERQARDPALAGKWVVVNTRSSVDPFLTSSSRRDLREKVWKAFKNRGDNGNDRDTNATIASIVDLRARRAALLGYPTHAHWRMANTMAVDPAKADDLMMRVWPAAVARVGQEVADMMTFARKDRVTTFEPWDYLYYAEKVRKQKYALDQDQLKPYFELNNMIAASFYMAERLYDLSFTEITGSVPVFHSDVRVWEVKDRATGAHRGLFYGDYFARPNKRSGAWASTYRGRETFTGAPITPITSNNNNFVRGAANAPVLISLDDAETLFHEFGHALHALLSEVNYPGLAGTPRDFVEYPSQVHEMWVMSRPILEKYALHYQTRQPMPPALIAKIEAAEKFNQGYATVEYLSSALLDMRLHTTTQPVTDIKAFERATLASLGAPREVAMRHRLPQFNHLFSSDSYSAGYYSYLWSEVMDADTRQAFVEAKDLFDKDTAARLRAFILAPGNTTDRGEAYRQFRGRDPDVRALLDKRGFPVAATGAAVGATGAAAGASGGGATRAKAPARAKRR